MSFAKGKLLKFFGRFCSNGGGGDGDGRERRAAAIFPDVFYAFGQEHEVSKPFWIH